MPRTRDVRRVAVVPARSGIRDPYEVGLSHFPDYRTAFASTGTPLGMDLSNILLGVGANVIAPGSGTLVAGGSTVITSAMNQLTHGGAATDQQRETRVTWTLKEANAGSPLAAALIIAAPANVGSNEARQWQAALSQVNPAVLAQAYQAYPSGFWPEGQPDFYTDIGGPTHQQILREAASGNPIANAAAAGVAGVVNTMTTAVGLGPTKQVSPVVLIGLVGAVAFLALGRKRRG